MFLLGKTFKIFNFAVTVEKEWHSSGVSSRILKLEFYLTGFKKIAIKQKNCHGNAWSFSRKPAHISTF